MMKEFALQLETATGKSYDWKKSKIKYVPSQSHTQLLTTNSCLAHVINLATQTLISSYSKSPHFDPKEPDAHVPTSRDEIGLVRAIAVKVCISPSFLRSSPEKIFITDCWSGALFIKAKTDVENDPGQGKECASTPAYSRYESAVVFNVFDA